MVKRLWGGVKKGWKWAWGTLPGRYLLRVLIGVDQLGNALLGGHPDETISSRLGRWQKSRNKAENVVADGVCAVLNALDPNHCEKSIEFTEDGSPDPHHLGPRQEGKP